MDIAFAGTSNGVTDGRPIANTQVPWRRGQRGIGLALASGLAFSCGTVTPDPPAPVPPVVNSMEFFNQPAVATLLSQITEAVFSDVNQSFSNAAGLVFVWQYTNGQLPPPQPAQPTAPWPAGGQQNIVFYTNYASAFREASADFGTFFVTHMDGNPTGQTCSGLTYGVTATQSSGQPVSHPPHRFSFIFLEDLDGVASGCSLLSSARRNMFNMAVAHELGHQRAGLNHPEQVPGEHVATGHSVDAMRANVTITEMTQTPYPYFCRRGAAPLENDFGSCQGLLYMSRTVP